MTNTARGLGYRKDHAHRRLQKSSRALLGAHPDYPASASLERYEAPITDQGASGGCTFHGTPMCLWISCLAAGDPLAFFPSPQSGYALVRQIERALSTPQGQSLPALTDSGAMPSDVMVVCSQYGVRAMRGPTPDGRNSDVWTDQDVASIPNAPAANVDDEESLEGMEEDVQTLFTGEYRIDEKSSDFLGQIKAAISQGFAVGIGVFVDSAFMRFSADAAPLSKVDFTDPNGGGHWLCLDAYENDEFSGPNSWGLSWGAPALVDTVGCMNHGGHYRVTADWMLAQATQGMDVYVFQVTKTAKEEKPVEPPPSPVEPDPPPSPEVEPEPEPVEPEPIDSPAEPEHATTEPEPTPEGGAS